jgi:KDO2-lipid IV(A) lauroyltransferase
VHVEGPFPVPSTDDLHADVVAHTAQLTEVIEQYIRRYPDQWLWLHRRWKVQPPNSQMLILAPTPNSNVGAGTKMGGVV